MLSAFNYMDTGHVLYGKKKQMAGKENPTKFFLFLLAA